MTRRDILIAAAGASLLAFLLYVVAPAREPRYQGRSLRQWLTAAIAGTSPEDRAAFESSRELSAITSPAGREAVNAVHHIGTNAIPILLEWLERPRSALRQNLREILGLLPRAARRGPLDLSGGENRSELGMQGFRFLGPDAAAAAPALNRLLLDPNVSQTSRESAAYCLAAIGKPGLQPLLDAFVNTNQPGRRLMAFYIGKMRYLGSNAAPAVPVLIRSLADPGEDIAGRAAATLGDLAIEPATAVPALTNALVDPRPFVRRSAIIALKNFRQDAKPAVPQLVLALTDTNAPIRSAATNALREILPDATGDNWRSGVVE